MIYVQVELLKMLQKKNTPRSLLKLFQEFQEFSPKKYYGIPNNISLEILQQPFRESLGAYPVFHSEITPEVLILTNDFRQGFCFSKNLYPVIP